MASDLNHNMPTGYSNYFSGCIPVLNMRAPVSGWPSVKKLFRTTKVLFTQTENRDLAQVLSFFYPQHGNL